MNSESTSNSTFRYAVTLGLMTAVGAFGIDTYLPAFQAIAKSLHVNEGDVQLSLTSYFVALALGQAIYGPISDRIGRRIPMIVGFALFIATSIATIFAHDIRTLIILRFIQGAGACAGMVIPRAIVRDLRSGEEAAKLFALMLLVLSVSPILAPIVGSILLRFFSWHAIFIFFAIYGTLCLLTVLFFLEETLVPSRRSAGIMPAFLNYAKLIKDRHFIGTVMIGGISQGGVFAYLASSSFVYVTRHGLSPGQYSLMFGLNAAGLIGAAQFNVMLMRRFGATRLIRFASIVYTIAGVSLAVLAFLHHDYFVTTAVALFVVLSCFGFIGPTSGVLALEPHPAMAGSASALMGTLQYFCGALASGIVGGCFNNTAVPLGLSLAICGLGAATLAFFTVRTTDPVNKNLTLSPAEGH